MKSGLKDIDAIAEEQSKPGFKNTIIALELSEETLDRVSAIFWNRAGAHTNEVIQKLERNSVPKLSRYSSTISMNKPLFKRIDTLWQNRKKLRLTAEETRVLERYWKGYVKSGAKLAAKQQKQLAKINEQLAGLGTRFGQNMLADESVWALFLGEAQLAGIPDFLKSAMASAATERGDKKANLQSPCRARSLNLSLTFSENRELREKAFRAWTCTRAKMAEKPTTGKIVAEMLKLRQKRPNCLATTTMRNSSSTTRWPRPLARLTNSWRRSGKKPASAPARKRPNCRS